MKLSSEAAYSYKYATAIDNRNVLYLYQRGEDNGYIVLAANDDFTPVLGYCDEGTLPGDYSQLPDNLRYWLESLASEIDYASKHGGALKSPAFAEKTNIEPLCTTKWNQSAPFNEKCPERNGSTCVTGCVATAMAQVLKYYNYPTKGIGTHSYTWEEGGNKTISFDYGNTTFDWENMIDSYNGSYNSTEADAVATLMYACGVGVDMKYTEVESGAYSVNIPRALVENFGYNEYATYLQRDFYTFAEWEGYVYNTLANNGPVLFSGRNESSGHQFVCDGFNDGYYHFNWGWGGVSDGWFLLSALDPRSQGIGGSNSGYNQNQAIIANLSTTANPDGTHYFAWYGNFNIDSSSVDLGSNIFVSGELYNYTYKTVMGLTFGVMIVHEDGSDPIFYADIDGVTDLTSGGGLPYMYGWREVQYYVTIPTSLADGKYTIYPAIKCDNEKPQIIGVENTYRRMYDMTVSNGKAVFTVPAHASVAVSDLTVDQNLYYNTYTQFSAKLKNESSTMEYSENVALVVEINGSKQAVTDATSVTILPGESYNLSTVLKVNSYESSDLTGACKVYLAEVDNNGNYTYISDAVDSYLRAEASPSYNVIGPSVADNQPLDNINASCTLKCTSGYFAGTLTFYIAQAGTGRIVKGVTSDFITADANTSKIIDFNVDFSEGEENHEYWAAIFCNGSQASGITRFTTGVKTSVENISTNTKEIVKEEYFTLSGMPINAKQLQDGIYIHRVTYTNGNVITRKIHAK